MTRRAKTKAPPRNPVAETARKIRSAKRRIALVLLAAIGMTAAILLLDDRLSAAIGAFAGAFVGATIVGAITFVALIDVWFSPPEKGPKAGQLALPNADRSPTRAPVAPTLAGGATIAAPPADRPSTVALATQAMWSTPADELPEAPLVEARPPKAARPATDELERLDIALQSAFGDVWLVVPGIDTPAGLRLGGVAITDVALPITTSAARLSGQLRTGGRIDLNLAKFAAASPTGRFSMWPGTTGSAAFCRGGALIVLTGAGRTDISADDSEHLSRALDLVLSGRSIQHAMSAIKAMLDELAAPDRIIIAAVESSGELTVSGPSGVAYRVVRSDEGGRTLRIADGYGSALVEAGSTLWMQPADGPAVAVEIV